MTHIYVSKLAIIGSDNGLSPGRHQRTNFNEILIKIHTFSSEKMHLKMSSAKRWPFCLGLNVLNTIEHIDIVIPPLLQYEGESPQEPRSPPFSPNDSPPLSPPNESQRLDGHQGGGGVPGHGYAPMGFPNNNHVSHPHGMEKDWASFEDDSQGTGTGFGIKTVFLDVGITMIKIKRLWDRLFLWEYHMAS